MSRSEVRAQSSYRNNVAQKIRSKLVSEQIADASEVRSSTPSDFAKVSHEGSPNRMPLNDNGRKAEAETIITANKENTAISVIEESAMESTNTDLDEKK